jgi:formylglycine-generating enzyme required for sulfatase activity
MFKMELSHIKWILAVIVLSVWSCITDSKEKLEVVTYSQFNEFVKKTGYITDAEKFGWSIVQQDVFNYIKVEGANWKNPDGKNVTTSGDLPVTQVSYNDAMAYCKWSGSRLPTYDEYWHLIERDDRKVISDNTAPITTVNKANILGNVWEITTTENNGNIRLAGGSLFCSPNTCHGTKKDREIYVDKQTGNFHIGFAVLR